MPSEVASPFENLRPSAESPFSPSDQRRTEIWADGLFRGEDSQKARLERSSKMAAVEHRDVEHCVMISGVAKTINRGFDRQLQDSCSCPAAVGLPLTAEKWFQVAQ